MFERLRTLRGVIRSLRIYYGNRAHAPAMERLYRHFVTSGDLVFDIGAHVGDRVAVFRKLGARVVAAEPQPALVATLRLFYGRDRNVMIEPVAIGREAGTLDLQINLDNPTVSTASADFVAAAADAPGWEGQSWSKRVCVSVVTIDDLIARHGMPAFIKIDVEGFEAEVLAGCSRPPKALSFEFTTIQREIARACIERCVALGFTRFNAALGESQSLLHGEGIDGVAITRWLMELPHAANSGDVYAILG
jgi:FkbM family methyltransferase